MPKLFLLLKYVFASPDLVPSFFFSLPFLLPFFLFLVDCPLALFSFSFAHLYYLLGPFLSVRILNLPLQYFSLPFPNALIPS